MVRTTMLQNYIDELIESARDKQQRALAAYRAACHEEEHGRQMRDEYYRLTNVPQEADTCSLRFTPEESR